MADAARPIIGAGFLRYYSLLLDIRRCRLIDPTTKTVIETVTATEPGISIHVSSQPAIWTDIVKHFPKVT